MLIGLAQLLLPLQDGYSHSISHVVLRCSVVFPPTTVIERTGALRSLHQGTSQRISCVPREVSVTEMGVSPLYPFSFWQELENHLSFLGCTARAACICLFRYLGAYVCIGLGCRTGKSVFLSSGDNSHTIAGIPLRLPFPLPLERALMVP